MSDLDLLRQRLYAAGSAPRRPPAHVPGMLPALAGQAAPGLRGSRSAPGLVDRPAAAYLIGEGAQIARL